MFYILIQNGAVHEVIPEYHEDFPGIHISERYTPDFLAQTVQSDVEIPLGWLYDGESGTFSPPPEPEIPEVLPDLESTRQARLAENAQVYQELTETGFKSDVKGDGLKPYRFGLEEILGLDGLCLQIAFHLQAEPSGESLRLFAWKNAEQLMCDDDWHWTQIKTLFAEFGAFKEAMQWRRDSINAELITAETAEAIAAVVIDYSDLLVFGGGDGSG